VKLQFNIILSSAGIYTNLSIKESWMGNIAKLSVDFSLNVTFMSPTSQYDRTAASEPALNELKTYFAYIIAKRKRAITINNISSPAQNLPNINALAYYCAFCM
jgi:hypothetical protein